MRKKNYKGAKVSKRVVAKCEGVCRTYDAIQYAYANLLSETEEVKSFQVNVLLQGLEEGAYTSDFVITKADGNLMVRKCVSRKHLKKPMTTKLLDASRNYWKSHGVSDWGIVIEERCRLMNKADMRKGMLLKGKVGAEEKIYQVLDLKEKVLVLDYVKKTMPVWKTYEELSDCVEKEEESMAEATDIIDAMVGESRKTAYQRYNMISGILPFFLEENMRTEAIKRVSERYGISKQTVRNYLCEYLATMDVRSLAPGNKKAEKKLSADDKNMRKSLNKWYYTTKKRTLKNCYTLMLQHFYCNADGTLREQYPSYYQFRYFYRRYNKKETEYISRNGLSYYQRNQRPLTGDGVQAFAPTIGMGMLDATVCDIYLVNESGTIVGRPILTLCVDAYSGVICGYLLFCKLNDAPVVTLNDAVTV
jgi:hypothetical protein